MSYTYRAGKLHGYFDVRAPSGETVAPVVGEGNAKRITKELNRLLSTGTAPTPMPSPATNKVVAKPRPQAKQQKKHHNRGPNKRR